MMLNMKNLEHEYYPNITKELVEQLCDSDLMYLLIEGMRSTDEVNTTDAEFAMGDLARAMADYLEDIDTKDPDKKRYVEELRAIGDDYHDRAYYYCKEEKYQYCGGDCDDDYEDGEE